MAYEWLAFTFAPAVLDWMALAIGRRHIRFFAKPVTLLGLIAWFSIVGRWQDGLIWFGLALVFSLLGDVFLLLPERWFTAGLASFLVAHILYLIGFNQSWPNLSWWSILYVIFVLVMAWRIFPGILKGLNRNAETKKLSVPVLIYATMISLMLISALMNIFRPDWLPFEAWLTAVGALLFFLSDSILATNRFVRPNRWGELPVMITYHLAQIAITWGVLLHYTR